MRTYIFVDAENHFHRSVEFAAELFGVPRSAEALGAAKIPISVTGAFPSAINDQRFGFDQDMRFFWDCSVLAHYWDPGHNQPFTYGPTRAIYVCSAIGAIERVHAVRTWLRKLHFEPIVIQELKTQYDKRRASLEQYKLIDKPKGCDIALATRMVADGAANHFDRCFLFTSDADYLPAVKAIREMGKVVYVFGYADTLPANSEYEFVPDRFIDLGEYIAGAMKHYRGIILESMSRLGISTAPPPSP